MPLFDRYVPAELRSNIKEAYRAFEYFRERTRHPFEERFSQIEIETNTNCNRACRICPVRSAPRRGGLMEDSLYATLLDQLEEMDYRGRLAPLFYNEPFLDSRLANLMAKAREKLPLAEILVYTNGSLATAQNLAELVEAGVDGIIISQYQDNVGRDDARPLLKSLDPKIRRHVRYRILTEEDPLSNRGGLVRVRNPTGKNVCFQASTNAIVDYRGNVVLCCNDYQTTHVFGNIKNASIVEIWNKKEFKQVRAELRRGIFEWEMCKECAGEK